MRIITRPMDLGTIEMNLHTYGSFSEFVENVRLVFDNCLKYNPESSFEIRVMAKCLSYYFETVLKTMGDWEGE